MKIIKTKNLNLILINLAAIYYDSLYDNKNVNVLYIEEILEGLLNKKKADQLIKEGKIINDIKIIKNKK